MSARAALVDRCPFCNRWIRQRTPENNSAFHAILNDISEQRDWPKGSGVMLDVEQWKRLMISAYERAHGRRAEFFPAIDGQGFDVVYRRSSKMSDIEMSEMKHFARAWAIENDVVLREPPERDAA